MNLLFQMVSNIFRVYDGQRGKELLQQLLRSWRPTGVLLRKIRRNSKRHAQGYHGCREKSLHSH